MLPILIGICAFALIAMVVVYISLQRKMQEGGKAYEIEKMLSSTKSKGFSMEVFYQKVYLILAKTPYISRYLFKIRKRLEILSNNDEFAVRKQSAKITLISTIITIVLLAVLVYLNKTDFYMLILSVLGIIVLHETFVDVMVNKLEDKLLKQQLDFFSEVRHYYHEYGMVEEAVYEAAQSIGTEISVQGQAIYDMLVANNSEDELEQYYDTAPNRFLKAFAGVSYLTKEFGDRKIDGASLYLKNVNNITQELQLEILKRDKIDYIFQSLSIISIAPLFVINALKSWALSTFAITSIFYDGKVGKVVEIIILLAGFLCYNLLRRIKENNDRVKVVNSKPNRWQAVVYKFPLVEWIVDRLMPRAGTMQFQKENQLLIDTQSNLKLEWVYINRICAGIACFGVMLVLMGYLHIFATNQVYTQPTTESMSFGAMSESDAKKANELTAFDNYFIEKYKDKEVTRQELVTSLLTTTDVSNKFRTEEEAAAAADRILEKIDTVNNEYIKPIEMVIAISVGIFGYFIPLIILKFQRKMRQLEMENEIMQFQTLILMLMRIERISVQDILEWLERFSNIFRPQISTCLNNFEAGGWKALDQMREQTGFEPFVKIIKNLQSAVDKIPIVDAFDELESERAFFQEKRKEANERLIAKKSMYGKVIGFAPMILLFVAYLIVPLIYVSMTFMGEYLAQMSTYM